VQRLHAGVATKLDNWTGNWLSVVQLVLLVHKEYKVLLG
jgi:hypothetical protein